MSDLWLVVVGAMAYGLMCAVFDLPIPLIGK